ncbi:celE [Symbiodinium natans]|uniref:CelE protein n=1 Tax=Symbiodinium natans TaxID=878477 RepID=A0A812IJP4_9DINO|nr:celE [Symbiodinium natans]
MRRLLPGLCLGLLADGRAEACVDDAVCGSTSWLQETYTLGSRLATESESKQAGPLTDELYAEGFSAVTVPIGPGVILSIVVFILLLTAHEAFVAAGAKPLLANHEKPNSIPLQCTFAIHWLLLMVNLSMLVPVSLDYAMAMGHSATASGLFLSAPTVFALLGTMLGKPLTSEVNWDQAFARRLYLGCQGLAFAGNLILAFLMQAASHWNDATRQTWFWCFLLVNGANQFFQLLPSVGFQTMWNIVTPNSQKTLWSMTTIACRNSGFIVGPVCFAALSFTVRRGRDISPISMMSWSFVGLAMFQALVLTTASLCLPTEVTPLEEDGKAAKEDQDMELSPEDLPPESRQELVKNAIVYSCERPFTAAAVEVSTMMLLEVQYGWSAEFCGASFMSVGAATLASTIICTVAVSRKWIRESWLFLGSTLVSLSGVFLLFDWSFYGASGGGFLLLADSLVYAFSGVSMGIAQGWATRATMKGTSYDIQTYRVQSIAAGLLSRFLAPIFTRFILDFGGRNLYALAQGARHGQEESKKNANNNEPTPNTYQEKACVDDAVCGGTSWLQETYTLDSRLATESESKQAGPLTDELYAEGFSAVTVPIGPGLILSIVIFILLLTAHEAFVAAGAKPLLANHERPNSIPLQCTFAMHWLIMMVNLSMLVPVSLDYALAMGHSATASGLFLSAPKVFALLGTMLGKPLTSEVNWDQAASHWNDATRQTCFWCFLLVNGANQFFQLLPSVGFQTMWNIVTPNSQKTLWSMIAIACRNSGFIVGPVSFAAISFTVRRGRDISPISMMSWSFVGLAMFQALVLTTASLCLPTEVTPLEEDGKAAKEDQDMELSPEDLPPESRQELVKNAIVYSYERTFTTAAVEVSTMMLLEVQYGWSAEFCGAAFMSVGAATMAATIISTVAVSRKWIRESWLFMGSTLVSLSGVFLLFDWPFYGASGGGFLLLADSLVYAFSGVSMGIAQGWATRATMKGTSYDIQTYRVQSIAASLISKFLAPIFTRFILDFGGRNLYALAQGARHGQESKKNANNNEPTPNTCQGKERGESFDGSGKLFCPCSSQLEIVGRHQELVAEDGGCGGVAFDFQGVEIHARFNGTSWAEVVMSQAGANPLLYKANFFNVYVNSNLTSSFNTSFWMSQGIVAVPLFAGLDPDEAYDVVIVKNTEPQFSEPYVASNFLTLHGFRGSEEAQLEEVPALPERRIEFLGDSIAAGFCNNANPCLPRNSSICSPSNQWFNESWPSLICKGLGAQCHTAAWSGLGMAANCCGGYTLMSTVWLRTVGSLESLNQLMPFQTPEDNLWDFSRWVPDAVVINLGTNDHFQWPVVVPAFNATYLQLLLLAARSYGPKTHFFLACGPMTDAYCDNVFWVIDQAREVLPKLKVSFLDQRPFLNGSFGPRCGYHPSVEVDSAMAEAAIPIIQEALNWQ